MELKQSIYDQLRLDHKEPVENYILVKICMGNLGVHMDPKLVLVSKNITIGELCKSLTANFTNKHENLIFTSDIKGQEGIGKFSDSTINLYDGQILYPTYGLQDGKWRILSYISTSKKCSECKNKGIYSIVNGFTINRYCANCIGVSRTYMCYTCGNEGANAIPYNPEIHKFQTTLKNLYITACTSKCSAVNNRFCEDCGIPIINHKCTFKLRRNGQNDSDKTEVNKNNNSK